MDQSQVGYDHDVHWDQYQIHPSHNFEATRFHSWK
jgi:hypothetical protein